MRYHILPPPLDPKGLKWPELWWGSQLGNDSKLGWMEEARRGTVHWKYCNPLSREIQRHLCDKTFKKLHAWNHSIEFCYNHKSFDGGISPRWCKSSKPAEARTHSRVKGGIQFMMRHHLLSSEQGGQSAESHYPWHGKIAQALQKQTSENATKSWRTIKRPSSKGGGQYSDNNDNSSSNDLREKLSKRRTWQRPVSRDVNGTGIPISIRCTISWVWIIADND
jgi:hypothetical protein